MENRQLARRRLDERLQPLRAFGPPPAYGWLRAIRDALGMSRTQLAERLQVKQPSVAELERNEVEGRVTLASLRRAAEAIDCTLVYAIVPRQRSLETAVEIAAEKAALQELAPVFHTMRLEDQAPRKGDQREMLNALAAEIARVGGRRLWG